MPGDGIAGECLLARDVCWNFGYPGGFCPWCILRLTGIYDSGIFESFGRPWIRLCENSTRRDVGTVFQGDVSTGSVSYLSSKLTHWIDSLAWALKMIDEIAVYKIYERLAMERLL